jgi:hypothetical protein
MNEDRSMNDTEIKDLIEPVLHAALENHGFESAEVRSGLDHDGDPVLFIKLRFGPPAHMLSGAEANNVLALTGRLLVQHGEERFPHMDYSFPADPATKARLRSEIRDLLQA